MTMSLLVAVTTVVLLLSTCSSNPTANYTQSQARGLKAAPLRLLEPTTPVADLSAAPIPFPSPAADGSPYSVITTHNDVQRAIAFFLARDVCIPHIRPEHAAWNDYGGKLQIFLPPPCNSTDAQPEPASECAQRDDITAKITGLGYLMGNAHQEVLYGVPVPSRTNASVTWHSGLTAILRPGHPKHLWHLWESVGMMWHLILHPEQYDFVQHIDQVVAPISVDDELAYNQDLLAVLLAAMADVQQPSKASLLLQTQTSLLRTNPGMHCFEQVIVPGIVDTESQTEDSESTTGSPIQLRIHATPLDADRVRHFIFNHFHTPLLHHHRHRIPADAVSRGPHATNMLAPVRVAFENRCPARRCLLNHRKVMEYLKASSIGPYLDFRVHKNTDHSASASGSETFPRSTRWLAELASFSDSSKGFGHGSDHGASAIRTTDVTPVSGPTFSFGKFNFAGQVAIAANADVWLGVHGAAIANAVLMRPNSVLVVMQPLGQSYWHEGAALGSGHRYLYTPLFNVSSCPACDIVPDSWLRTAKNPNLSLDHAIVENIAGIGRTSEGVDSNATRNSHTRVCERVLDCKFTVTPAELRLVEDALRQAVLHVYTVKRNVSFTLPPLHEERPERVYSYIWGK